MKKILRFLLILVLLVVVLIGAGALYIHLDGIPKYDVEKVSFKGDEHPDSTSLALGLKIASVQCIVCHYNQEDGKLSGRFLYELPPVFGKIHSYNITQSKEHGIGNWTDDQIAYFLRTGVKPSGQYVPIYMPKFPHMSDTDLKGILAFLHSDNKLVQPSERSSIPAEPSFLTKFLCHVAFKKLPYPTTAIAEPDTNDLVAYGRYLVVGRYDCYPCHSADFKKINLQEPEKSEGFMGGGNQLVTPNGDKEPEKHIIYTANLTPDEETGIGTWTEDDFRRAMLEQKNKDGHALRQPMLPYNGMSDLEVKAIYKYLRSLPPIKNKVNRQYENAEL